MTISDADYLRARYGNPTNDKRTLWTVASLAIAIGLFWLIWQTLALARPTASADPIAMVVKSPSEVVVTYNVFAPVGSTVSCDVSAFTDARTEVGFRTVTVGPIPNESQSVTVSIPTIQEVTSVTVENCQILGP